MDRREGVGHRRGVGVVIFILLIHGKQGVRVIVLVTSVTLGLGSNRLPTIASRCLSPRPSPQECKR